MIVVMPMAGRGSRFKNKGYEVPKPLIDVNGLPMFVQSLKSLNDLSFDLLVLIALQEHEDEFKISELLTQYLPDQKTELVLIPDVTEGQLCTVMVAEEYFKGKPLLIVASDTYILSEIGADVRKYQASDGLIQVMEMPGDAWSFAKVDEQEKVIEVAEKVRISEWASTGTYYFKDGSLFASFSNAMINAKEKTRGEYYIMPVYQKYIDEGYQINITKAIEMWDMGNPESLNKFLNKIKNSNEA